MRNLSRTPKIPLAYPWGYTYPRLRTPALDVDDLKIHFKARKGIILNYLQKVQKIHESIIEVYDQGDESVEERKLAEITSQIGYNDSICDELTLIERQIDISLPANSNPPLQPPMAVKIPKLECKIFDALPKTNWNSRIFLLNFPIVLMPVVHCPMPIS